MSNPWEAIKPPVSNYNIRRVDPNHTFDFYWAKNIEGNYLFLFQCRSEVLFPKNFPQLQGIKIIVPEPGAAGEHYLLLELLDKKDWDIFISLCRDLTSSSAKMPNEAGVLALIINRLKRWHLFLKKFRSAILSEAEQKGLIGELIFLRDYLLPSFSVHDSLAFWQGPLDSPQDFCIGDTAVEVKCRLGTSRSYVSISSADQLMCSLSHLFLTVVTLGKAACDDKSAVTLPGVIDEIRSSIQVNSPESLENFNDLLLQAGFFDHPDYDEFCFIFYGIETFVVEEGFPMITQEDLPDGVCRVRYEIMLDKCSPFEIDADSFRQSIRKL